MGMATPALISGPAIPDPAHRMPFINTFHVSLRAAKRHTSSTRRFLSSVNTHEAFLQPLPSHPGITTLSLNRPHAKNAISLQLLKVRCILFFSLTTESISPTRTDGI
jgi:hypothetical protein